MQARKTVIQFCGQELVEQFSIVFSPSKKTELRNMKNLSKVCHSNCKSFEKKFTKKFQYDKNIVLVF